MRPKEGYFVDGEKVPSVTTVLGRFKESGGLMYWAWQQGKDGKDFRETSKSAADAGTCAHAMVEADVRGVPFDESPYTPETLTRATGSFKAYKEWAKQSRLQPAETELSLVSCVHGFGGTLDSIMVQGELSLVDIKTSARVYPEYLLQLAGYAILFEETHPNHPLEGGFHILRFSKQTDDLDIVSFSHSWWSDLTIAKDCFLHLLAAYKLDRRIKQLV